MERVTISVENDLLAAFDAYANTKGYENRSAALRDAMRHILAETQVDEDAEQPCVGCVVYVYDHRERTLSSRLLETQHHHHDMTAATMHLHIDDAHCLEATVLSGTVGSVRQQADRITSMKGVRYGRLHIVPTEVPHNGK